MSQPNLFAENRQPEKGIATPPDPDLVARIRRSAAWAAFGDAVGFISELTDTDGLKRRTKGRKLDTTMAWNRRIGGRTGAQIELPAGCYSDDTQLRLATSRSIVDGEFDVETFAKIELPVFPAYALGGGVGTKAAAVNLGRSSTPWFGNTYKNWLNGGGNGAAMRCQPHVWSAHARHDDKLMLRDVLRNTVCTHAHPIAVLGSYIHALSVDYALRHGAAPDADALALFLQDSPHIVEVMDDDRDGLRNWKSAWQSGSNRPFSAGLQDAVAEIDRCLALAVNIRDDSHDFYPNLLQALGLFEPDRRGSGAHTALAASLLAARNDAPGRVISTAAAAIGSDTDTIATMAGAVLGCFSDVHPHGVMLDATYVESEVDRITNYADGSPSERHHYPDLLTWSAPRTQADALCLDANQPHVAGLGDVARLIGEPTWGQDRKFAWQWAELAFGQTVLIKRRPELDQLAEGNRIVQPRRPGRSEEFPSTARADNEGASDVDDPTVIDLTASPTTDRNPIDVSTVVAWLEQQGFDDKSIGYAFRRMAARGTPAQVASFLAVVLDRVTGDSPDAK